MTDDDIVYILKSFGHKPNPDNVLKCMECDIKVRRDRNEFGGNEKYISIGEVGFGFKKEWVNDFASSCIGEVNKHTLYCSKYKILL
jgi:hypothetical protein